MSSIEYINVEASKPDSSLTWQLIELTNEYFSPRFNIVLEAINENQALILGGFLAGNKMSDIYLFDATENTITTEVESGDFKF